MTFTELVAEVAEDLNLTSTVATTRIGREINRRYREIVTSLGLVTSARGVTTATAVVGNRNLTFTSTLKILSVYDNSAIAISTLTSSSTTATATTAAAHDYTTGAAITISGASQTEYNGNYILTVTGATTFTYTFAGSVTTPATGTIAVGLQEPQRVLGEISFDEMRNQSLSTQPPQQYAISRMGASSVTIYLDCIPTTAFILSADIMESTSTLSGSTEPAFNANFHDILIHAGKVPELLKMEKPDLSQAAENDYQRRLGELRLFIRMSAYAQMYQGKR